MQGLAVVVAIAVGAVLVVLWTVQMRQDLARRASRNADWDTDAAEGTVPSVWTSTARCPECLARGAVISREQDGLWHSCMACGARHRREVNG